MSSTSISSCLQSHSFGWMQTREISFAFACGHARHRLHPNAENKKKNGVLPRRWLPPTVKQSSSCSPERQKGKVTRQIEWWLVAQQTQLATSSGGKGPQVQWRNNEVIGPKGGCGHQAQKKNRLHHTRTLGRSRGMFPFGQRHWTTWMGTFPRVGVTC